jgi:hypothetical protein
MQIALETILFPILIAMQTYKELKN